MNGSNKATAAKHAVILCHPAEDSFNAAVARHYCDAVSACGQQAVLRDLYRMDFNPVLANEERPVSNHPPPLADVVHELDLIADAHVVVLVYPIWYGMPPAMLKGYIDRVLGAGVSYGASRNRPAHSYLAGKRMLSITSSASTTQWLEEQGAMGSLRHLVDDYLRHTLSLSETRHLHFPAIVPGLRPRFIDEALAQVEQVARLECSLVRQHGSNSGGLLKSASRGA